MSTLSLNDLIYNYGNDSEEDYYCPSSEEDDVDLGLDLEKLNLGPRKKLLVLCLGGLLVSRIRIGKSGRGKKADLGRRADLVHGNFLIFKRPFCEEFLQFCFQRFEVGIWSSAEEHNTEGMIECLGQEISSRFAFVWDQDYCTDTGHESLDNIKKNLLLKKLKRIWKNRYPINRTWPTGTYSSLNTLLIDTEPSKALLNPADTGIFPLEYKFKKNQQDTYLGPDGPLCKFLDGLTDAEDVPSYVKENRIGQPEIQSSHPDWDYYKSVIESIS